jgi:hypothetical protein
MKGQTLIIQFILFFLIGFTLFASMGLFFQAQSQIFKNDIINYNLQLINSYMSSIVLTEAVSCKQCDFINVTVKIQNTTAGNFFEVGMRTLNGLNTTVPQSQKSVTSTIYNLNSSYILSGFSASVKPISITFTKSLNNLRVS